jgi:DegV family protein with EDD domain
MAFLMNDKLLREDIDITQKEFFEMLEDRELNVSTSQPAPAEVTELWDKVLEENDELVYIPLSSGLSNSYQTAKLLAEDYDGKVEVINNQRISVTMRQSVEDALYLSYNGWSAAQIREKLEEEKFNSSIYIMVDTLKFLKKGGRVTPAAALIGSVLHIKPVLQIQGEKLDAFAKCRGTRQAKKTMIDAIRKDMEGRFKDFTDKGEAVIRYAYSEGDAPEDVKEWEAELKEAFPGYEITGDPLSLVVGCHIGPGSLAVTVSHKVVI